MSGAGEQRPISASLTSQVSRLPLLHETRAGNKHCHPKCVSLKPRHLMKRISVPAALLLAAGFMTACDEPPEPRERPSPYGRTQTSRPRPDPGPPVEQPYDEPSDPPPGPPPSAPTTQEPVKQGDIPYAKAVAGKPGFVTSPYSPGSGYVDVRGFPPGTEVKDPYTGKIFLVP